MVPTLNLSTLYRTPIFTLRLANAAPKGAYGAIYRGNLQEWQFPGFYPVHSFVIAALKKLVPGLQIYGDLALPQPRGVEETCPQVLVKMKQTVMLVLVRIGNETKILRQCQWFC